MAVWGGVHIALTQLPYNDRLDKYIEFIEAELPPDCSMSEPQQAVFLDGRHDKEMARITTLRRSLNQMPSAQFSLLGQARLPKKNGTFGDDRTKASRQLTIEQRAPSLRAAIQEPVHPLEAWHLFEAGLRRLTGMTAFRQIQKMLPSMRGYQAAMWIVRQQ